jgi:hypothetical protein
VRDDACGREGVRALTPSRQRRVAFELGSGNRRDPVSFKSEAKAAIF